MKDTIVARASGAGSGGICVLRLSGDDAVLIASRVFRSKVPLTEKPTHTVTYGFAYNRDGEVLDECLATVMLAPRSYTMENTVEISCHGGFTAARMVEEALLFAGARPAEPGEFTLRAFLNGRIDLTKAESVADIITAKTSRSLKSAVTQLRGGLFDTVKAYRERILSLSATIMAANDFPEEIEEELTNRELLAEITQLEQDLKKTLATADTGRMLTEGAKICLVGKPNTGKSSLMNRLLKENRAIVTDIPGTTRDTIEAWMEIDGIPMMLYDTAGIHETEDAVEKIGTQRAVSCLKEADICLFVLDASKEAEEEDREVLSLLENSDVITIENKCDLEHKLSFKTPFKTLQISTKSGEGVDSLLSVLKEKLGQNNAENGAVIANERQKKALVEALDALERAKYAFEDGMPSDLIFIDLESALAALGEITGENVSEDVIDTIFSRFCVGK